MFNLPKEIALFDIECTTWDGAAARNWSGPSEHREIVQLGAALVDTVNFEETDTKMWFVKPQINPELSDYFLNLTGITQEEVNLHGISFEKFLKEFYDLCGDRDLYCFDSRVDGSRLFDMDVLIENCGLFGIQFPFERNRFHNVNMIFHNHGYTVKQSGSTPEVFGIELPAKPHNALNDVRGVLVGLQALSQRLG